MVINFTPLSNGSKAVMVNGEHVGVLSKANPAKVWQFEAAYGGNLVGWQAWGYRQLAYAKSNVKRLLKAGCLTFPVAKPEGWDFAQVG